MLCFTIPLEAQAPLQAVFFLPLDKLKLTGNNTQLKAHVCVGEGCVTLSNSTPVHFNFQTQTAVKRRQTGIHSSHIKILVGQGEHLTPPCFNAPCLFLISLNRSRLGIVYFQWPLPAMQRQSVSVPNPSYAQAQGCTFTGGKKGVSSWDQPFTQLRSKSFAKKFHLPFCLYSHLKREEVDNLSNKWLRVF